MGILLTQLNFVLTASPSWDGLLSWTGRLIAALVVLILIRALYEPGSLDITHQTLISQHPASNQLAVRVALFSDLHADLLRIKPKVLIAALLDTPVDLLIFLGDLASKDEKAGKATWFLSQIAAAAHQANIPFLAVPGNHDGVNAHRVMCEAGLDLLKNEQRSVITASGVRLMITGLSDLHTGSPNPQLLKTDKERMSSDEQIRIVLAHNPDTILKLPLDGGDFFFSGHFHGGQIYAPLQMEFRLLRSDILPRQGIWRGVFSMLGYCGYITRGLGCVWLPLRFLSKPELTILDLIRSVDGLLLDPPNL